MRFSRVVCPAIMAMGTALIHAQDKHTPITADFSPPAYADLQRNQDGSAFLPNDGVWVAVWFIRQTTCIPPGFDLLDTDDFTPAFPGGPPRPFLCPLTVGGFVNWKDGPPPTNFVPTQISLQGLGAVPVWFAKLSEVQAAVADHNLTLGELLALPSLRKGTAKVFEEVGHPGMYRPQGSGNGSIEVTASGVLESGTGFQVEFREMGVKDGGGVSFVRHVRIAFQ
jgi:hypothetical protein